MRRTSQDHKSITACIKSLISGLRSPQTQSAFLPLRYICKTLFWWGKPHCRLERICVLIIVIFIYRSVGINKEWASHSQGNEGQKQSVPIVWTGWWSTMTELSAVRFRLYLEWCLWQVFYVWLPLPWGHGCTSFCEPFSLGCFRRLHERWYPSQLGVF